MVCMSFYDISNISISRRRKSSLNYAHTGTFIDIIMRIIFNFSISNLIQFYCRITTVSSSFSIKRKLFFSIFPFCHLLKWYGNLCHIIVYYLLLKSKCPSIESDDFRVLNYDYNQESHMSTHFLWLFFFQASKTFRTQNWLSTCIS